MVPYTFEYEAIGKDDPGCVECRIHYEFTPGSPEVGRFGPVEGYDPGSGPEVGYDYAEREVTKDGKTTWNRLKTGEWLDEQCRAYLAHQEPSELVDDDEGPDPDDARDARIDRELTERDSPRDFGGEC